MLRIVHILYTFHCSEFRTSKRSSLSLYLPKKLCQISNIWVKLDLKKEGRMVTRWTVHRNSIALKLSYHDCDVRYSREATAKYVKYLLLKVCLLCKAACKDTNSSAPDNNQLHQSVNAKFNSREFVSLIHWYWTRVWSFLSNEISHKLKLSFSGCVKVHTNKRHVTIRLTKVL